MTETTKNNRESLVLSAMYMRRRRVVLDEDPSADCVYPTVYPLSFVRDLRRRWPGEERDKCIDLIFDRVYDSNAYGS